VAIRGEFAWPPILLSAAVMFWVAGFDLIYALQDVDFDRKTKLFSLPSRFGIASALRVSMLSHALTVLLLMGTATLANLGWIAYVGIAIVAGILYWEHRLVTPHDLSRVNVAFFNLNGYISILLLLTFAGDILIK
jgi:4-hydroxybenzoate polyprenyltransferase